MSFADLLILKLGARLTKLLIESWLGKGAGTTIAGDVVDLLKGRFQSTADRKKAEREFEELGDRMARELLPLFQDAEKRGHLNPEAVVLALESNLAGLSSSAFLIQKDLEPGVILAELRKARPLPPAQFSQAETDLYERALERSARHLVEVASRLPKFEEAFAARSLQQLSRLTGNVDEILAGVRRIEATVGEKAQDEKAREYEIDYRLAVQRNLDYLEIFGIDLPPESRSQKLSVAYISVNLESHLKGALEALSAEALFDRFSKDHPHLLIRGDAGTGKSTLLRWAAMETASGKQRMRAANVDEFFDEEEQPHVESSFLTSWRMRIPFLVRLRQCKAGSLPSPEAFPELIAQALGSPPAEWVRSVLKDGRALLLLDGVDEIPNAHRETTRQAIREFVTQYPETYLVVSTRPRAVEPDWLAHLGFQEARINPLTELDRARFIDRWHEAVAEELKLRGKPVADLPGLAESLKKQLEDNPELARLATNPLLCAMICALHRDRGQKLPERQRQLCEDLCHALLHRRERESGLNLDDFPEPYRRLDYPQKRAAVQELAHHLVLNEYSSLPTEEAQEQIGKALKQFPGHSAADARVVTDSLVERSGILREESPGEISFIHNAFKELLAGDYFAGADSAGFLAKHALDPAWQPVILFAVAADLRGFATKIMERILEPGSGVFKAELRARQLMTLRCRAAALYVEEELDLRLQQLTVDLFPPRNMEDAEALATGGNTAVPFLVHSNKLTSNEAAASIRALRLVGTSQARQALRGFLGDRRKTVISELAQAVNPLEIEWVREQLLAGKKLPVGIAAQVSDLSPLTGLHHILRLDLMQIQVADLSPLAGLTNLQSLSLKGNLVADLSPLAGLHNLRSLYLTFTQVEDLSPLARLNNLENLYLAFTQVADLSPLAGLSNLQGLYLMQTQVTDVSPLAGLKNLQSLDLARTQVADLSPLAGLTNLRWLDVRDTHTDNPEVLKHLDCKILRGKR
ncbi:MAG TPA: leucine-rich repeat domain-containing protein [Thermoanaerobaculia bacterium]|nr:leucine-rich repeat domain-containing protein [Thermoanaerobaculia bacterium]